MRSSRSKPQTSGELRFCAWACVCGCLNVNVDVCAWLELGSKYLFLLHLPAPQRRCLFPPCCLSCLKTLQQEGPRGEEVLQASVG